MSSKIDLYSPLGRLLIDEENEHSFALRLKAELKCRFMFCECRSVTVMTL